MIRLEITYSGNQPGQVNKLVLEQEKDHLINHHKYFYNLFDDKFTKKSEQEHCSIDLTGLKYVCSERVLTTFFKIQPLSSLTDSNYQTKCTLDLTPKNPTTIETKFNTDQIYQIKLKDVFVLFHLSEYFGSKYVGRVLTKYMRDVKHFIKAKEVVVRKNPVKIIKSKVVTTIKNNEEEDELETEDMDESVEEDDDDEPEPSRQQRATEEDDVATTSSMIPRRLRVPAPVVKAKKGIYSITSDLSDKEDTDEDTDELFDELELCDEYNTLVEKCTSLVGEPKTKIVQEKIDQTVMEVQSEPKYNKSSGSWKAEVMRRLKKLEMINSFLNIQPEETIDLLVSSTSHIKAQVQVSLCTTTKFSIDQIRSEIKTYVRFQMIKEVFKYLFQIYVYYTDSHRTNKYTKLIRTIGSILNDKKLETSALQISRPELPIVLSLEDISLMSLYTTREFIEISSPFVRLERNTFKLNEIDPNMLSWESYPDTIIKKYNEVSYSIGAPSVKPFVLPDILKDLDWNQIVLAGGFVFGSVFNLSNAMLKSTDIDIFIYGPRQDQKTKLEYLLDYFSKFKPYYINRKSLWNILIPDFPYDIQIILTKSESPQEIVQGFDFNYVRMYYNGKNVWCTFDSLLALKYARAIYGYQNGSTVKVKPIRLYKTIMKGLEIESNREIEPFVKPNEPLLGECVEDLEGQLRKYNIIQKILKTDFEPVETGEIIKQMYSTRRVSRFYKEIMGNSTKTDKTYGFTSNNLKAQVKKAHIKLDQIVEVRANILERQVVYNVYYNIKGTSSTKPLYIGSENYCEVTGIKTKGITIKISDELKTHLTNLKNKICEKESGRPSQKRLNASRLRWGNEITLCYNKDQNHFSKLNAELKNQVENIILGETRVAFIACVKIYSERSTGRFVNWGIKFYLRKLYLKNVYPCIDV